jgi:hypothetical protein
MERQPQVGDLVKYYPLIAHAQSAGLAVVANISDEYARVLWCNARNLISKFQWLPLVDLKIVARA